MAPGGPAGHTGSVSPPADTTPPTAACDAHGETVLRPGRWTGGQASVVRVLTGLVVFVHFARLLPRADELVAGPRPRGAFGDGPVGRWFASWMPDALGVLGGHLGDGVSTAATPDGAEGVALGLVVLGALVALLLVLGWSERIAAASLVPVFVLFAGHDPLLPPIGALAFIAVLVLHAASASGPYGSLEARGRVDPRGDWSSRAAVGVTAWLVLAAVTGWTALWWWHDTAWHDGSALSDLLAGPRARDGALVSWVAHLPDGVLRGATWATFAAHALFVPLALLRATRPWAWGVMLVGQLVAALLLVGVDARLGLVLVHLVAFQPSWVPAKGGRGASTVFYDGDCGLCHRFTRFLLAEDPHGDTFTFAPLQGETFKVAIPEGPLGQLPDSVLVRTPCGDLLMRSDAALHCLRRLGGGWRLVSIAGRLVPRVVRDRVYDFVAAIRKSIFPKPKGMCPILPPDLQGRFLP